MKSLPVETLIDLHEEPGREAFERFNIMKKQETL